MNATGKKYAAFLEVDNVRAMLQVIGDCEGAKYNTLFGGGTFASYATHPNKKICRGNLCSTAAGKYQFLKRTWDEVQKKLGLQDFSPKNQDVAAVYLIARRKALQDVIDGNLPLIMKKLSWEWASIPPARYGQKTRSEKFITDRFKKYGGNAKSDTNLGAGIIPLVILGGLVIYLLR